MSGIKPKHQRLVLVSLALVAIVAAGLLAAWALRNQANYFYLPDQMMADPPAVGQAVRLGRHGGGRFDREAARWDHHLVRCD